MAWIIPKTDWNTNPINPTSIDFNRIEGNIAHLMQEIENKKGAVVDAINVKQPLVTLESSYQELADGINFINQNPRIAEGTGELTGLSDTQARLVVTGLSFKPSKLFLRGSVETRIADSTFPDPPYYAENWILCDYAIVNGVLRPATKMGTGFNVSGGMGFQFGSSSALSCSVTYQDNGFTVTITATQPSNRNQLRLLTTSARYQYWFAQE